MLWKWTLNDRNIERLRLILFKWQPFLIVPTTASIKFIELGIFASSQRFSNNGKVKKFEYLICLTKLLVSAANTL